jgi:peptidoglycan/LPS O-acetylase OafA/YrhL
MKDPRARLEQIDLLRGLAILLVLGRHMPNLNSALHPYSTIAVATVKRAGWVGVDLFFVLSGFLVSGLLFAEFKKHGNLHVGRFLVRRGLKIYPAFYVFLLMTVVVQACIYRQFDWRSTLSEALFITNYGSCLWPHTWSLAVEEHFYLLLSLFLPWAVRTDGSQRFRGLIPLFCVVASVVALLRVLMVAFFPPFSYKRDFYPTHLRIDALALGVVLAYFYHFKRQALLEWAERWRIRLCVIAITLVAPAVFLTIEESRYMQTVGLTAVYCGFGSLLLVALSCGWTTGGWSRPLKKACALIGLNSYSIYLWHMPVERWGLPLLGRLGVPIGRYPVLVAGYFAVSVACGLVMAKVVEFPVLAFRDRLFPSRAEG